MLNPGTNLLLPPQLSPTTSSSSCSSDLDTESTGSFFHDRSTTLGTLMGVTFPSITFRAPSQHRDPAAASSSAAAAGAPGGDSSIAIKRRKKKRRDRAALAAEQQQQRRKRRGGGRWWWNLCRDGDTKPASLGEFLEVERRFGDLAAAELEGGGAPGPAEEPRARVLFADGRVLPPPDVDDVASSSSTADGAICRFSVSLSGICCGGGTG